MTPTAQKIKFDLKEAYLITIPGRGCARQQLCIQIIKADKKKGTIVFDCQEKINWEV